MKSPNIPAKMKVNVVSKKLIKPSTPTPPDFQKYNLSFTDEFGPPMNVRILLFYQAQSKPINEELEKSLAQILPQFYPLAGRYIKHHHMVDCSDEGAEFIEAEALDVDSMNLVREMEADQLNLLLSRQFYQLDEAATCPLLSIQATHFKCGGLAIGISVSHRIFDGSSLETFVSAWSDYNSRGGTAIRPSFDSSSLFPRGNLDCTSFIEKSDVWNLSICAKRFLFTDEAISRLRRNRVDDESCEQVISRVRAVCALVTKALIRVDRAKHGRWRACLVVQAANMRARTVPAVAKHCCGNLAVQSITRCMSEAEVESVGVGELVGVLGEAIGKTALDCSRILWEGVDGLNEIIVNPVVNAFEKSSSGEANVVWFSDWSKFGFYEADFGWGKPVWVSIGPLAGENMTVLMGNKEGDGIEAWVHLRSSDMSYFEQDEELRIFAKCDKPYIIS